MISRNGLPQQWDTKPPMKTQWLSAFCVPLFAAAMLCPTAPALAFGICGGGPRHDCVVDGDTLWIGREKVRLTGIDTPERAGHSCHATGPIARAAQARLWQLMQAEPIRLMREGHDSYGRTLGSVTAGGIDVAMQLLAEGLARRYVRGESPWCG
jgi:micrococcal nuclease